MRAEEGAVKGLRMLTILVAATIAAASARAQNAPAAADEPAAEAPLGEEEAMVLNFERADIREVIHSLATALGISYTIDPRIEGQVTIRTAGKIAREDLWPLLNQILRNNGIAAVKVGDVYQILPVAEAKTRAIIPRSKATKSSLTEKDAFAIEVVPVAHVSADEMVNILQPCVTPGGDVLSYPRANLLVITDLQSNIDRLRELITTFDSDVFHNLKTRVFKVKNGDPDELANEILGLLAPYGVTPTGEGEGGVYIVPLTRLNSLVAVAFDKTMFDEIERWLRLLDIPPEEGAGRGAARSRRGGRGAASGVGGGGARARGSAARAAPPARPGPRARRGAPPPSAASRSPAAPARPGPRARRANRRARCPSSRRRCASSPIRSPTRSSCSPPSATTSSSPTCSRRSTSCRARCCSR